MERQLRAGVSLFLKIFFQRIPSARAVGCTPRPNEGKDGERGEGQRVLPTLPQRLLTVRTSSAGLRPTPRKDRGGTPVPLGVNLHAKGCLTCGFVHFYVTITLNFATDSAQTFLNFCPTHCPTAHYLHRHFDIKRR